MMLRNLQDAAVFVVNLKVCTTVTTTLNKCIHSQLDTNIAATINYTIRYNLEIMYSTITLCTTRQLESI